MTVNIDPPPRDERSLRERLQGNSTIKLHQPEKATPDQWRQAYDAKVADFAAETRKTSVLIQALQAMGHRSRWAHQDCPGCVALSEVNAIDPAPEVRCDPA